MTVPRSGWVKPESDRRLSDLVSVGVADQGFPSGCCRCGGRRSGADGATAAGVAGAGGDLFCDWDGAAFRGLLRGRVRATHRWSVVDDGMGAVVVSSDEIGYLSSTFTIGVRTAT